MSGSQIVGWRDVPISRNAQLADLGHMALALKRRVVRLLCRRCGEEVLCLSGSWAANRQRHPSCELRGTRRVPISKWDREEPA